MSTSKRFVVAIAMGAAITFLAFLCLMLFPVSLIGSAIVAVGMPLAAVLLEVLPTTFIHLIAPESRVAAVGLVLGFSTLLTWLIGVSTLCFFLSRRAGKPHDS